MNKLTNLIMIVVGSIIMGFPIRHVAPNISTWQHILMLFIILVGYNIFSYGILKFYVDKIKEK